MSSKLKRKLNDLGVDTQSRAVTENFCLIGTPLPPLEKSKDTGEFVPIWKQDVRDEKGRRRLHGAFTGGFSAGYFNTVGSKEGWAPSTFVSSRSDRTNKKTARPEDFMDEEDLAELRDNQKLVGSTDEMDLDFWSRNGKAEGTGEQDSITSALEAALLPAPQDSVGARILRKMGWRVGHGIGPKVTYEQRRRQVVLAHDITSDQKELPTTEDHDEAKKHLYPPRDTKVSSFARKDDKHGLGYTSGMGLTELVSADATSKSEKATKGPNISAGFGLGALNDADDDDLDVYDRGLDTGSRRIAYEDETEDRQIMIGSRHREKASVKPILRSSHVANQSIGQQIVFSDGTPCLTGFIVSNKKIVEDAWFPPPKIPPGWTPNPRKIWEQGKENKEIAEKPEIANKDALHRNNLTHAQRGDLLGEAPQAPRSIFDYLSPKDRERLQNLAAGRSQPQEQRGVEPAPLPAAEPESATPRLDPQVAKMALQGFQPFTSDPVKQARYTAFLKAQAEAEDSVPFGRMAGQAADVFQRELEDYARSAQIFKPVSGAMAGRFARATVFENGPQSQEGLHKPSNEGSYHSVPNSSVEEEPPKEESPKENAARLGMYGFLTREVKPWRPAKLLCKRFGVKEPEVELETETTATSASFAGANQSKSDALAITDGSENALMGSTQIRGEGDVPGPSSSTSTRWSGRDIENIGLGENEQQGQEILSYRRPAMDIFKAIFASDDEDDDNDEVKPDDEEVKFDEAPKLSENGTTGQSSRSPAQAQAPVEVVNYADAAGKVDMTSFKLTFVPRADRQKDNAQKEKSKHKDKGRKKKGKAALMSFDVEEDGGEMPNKRDRDRERSKQKKKKKEGKELAADDDDSMWVEKPVSEAVQALPISPPVPPEDTTDFIETKAGPQRGRKRAVDFL